MNYTETKRKRQMIWANCGLEGKNYSKEDMNSKNHMYIVSSRESYNKKSKSLNAFVLSSMKSNGSDYFRLNFGIDITNDDIDGDDSKIFNIDRETVVLCDRLLRINKEDIHERSQEIIFLKKDKFSQLLDSFTSFINKGIISF